MSRRTVTPARILSSRDGVTRQLPDTLATEEPMEIRVQGPGQEASPVAVTMRTPGNDFELAAGFLFTEGLLRKGEVARVAYCELPDREQHYNAVTVELTRPFEHPNPRSFFATSSCGICGKASLDQVEVACEHLPPGPRVAAATVVSFPHTLRRRQRVFDRTGGLHAAGLFEPSGALRILREDVGRHNAVDKVIGNALLDGGLPLHDSVLQVSGRVSFEIVQKAAVAGIPVVSAVSAPSSLAVQAGERLGMTIIGFVRDGSFNVYTHPDRVEMDP